MMLLRPFQVHHVDTPEQYRAFQATVIATNRQRYPKRTWTDPWVCNAVRPVYVALGKWLLRCVCGNAPSVDPDWELACCCECGAIYEHVVMPPHWQDIEAALLLRPSILNHGWSPTETVADLHAETLRRMPPGALSPATVQTLTATIQAAHAAEAMR
jgi:hypothetical protein